MYNGMIWSNKEQTRFYPAMKSTRKILNAHQLATDLEYSSWRIQTEEANHPAFPQPIQSLHQSRTNVIAGISLRTRRQGMSMTMKARPVKGSEQFLYKDHGSPHTALWIEMSATYSHIWTLHRHLAVVVVANVLPGMGK